MKKKLLSRCIRGFPTGIAIGYILTILKSLQMGNGAYFPCTPELIQVVGSEINAVLLQTLVTGSIGAGFAGCSVIWDIERWGIALQTGVFFLAISSIVLPAAYFMLWMEHSLAGFLAYYGSFTLFFVVICVVQLAIARHNIKKMNASLRKAGNSENKS